jgi:periplasmic divalent cation tolerance protein
MLEASSSARIVMTTVVSTEEGMRLGRTLVEERLAACATLVPAVESIYR